MKLLTNLIIVSILTFCSSSPVRDEIISIFENDNSTTSIIEEDYSNSTLLNSNSTTIPLPMEKTEPTSTIRISHHTHKKFTMQESMTVARTNDEGIKVCLTFYRHLADDDYTHEGICTLGNCIDDPDIVNCKTHFPEKFEDDLQPNEYN